MTLDTPAVAINKTSSSISHTSPTRVNSNSIVNCSFNSDQRYLNMSLPRAQALELQNTLQRAVIECSERCLYRSAKWAAELLDSLPIGDDEGDDEGDISMSDSDHYEPRAVQRDSSELLLEYSETPKYLAAKAFFDCHEFQRCAETLLPAGPSGFSHLLPKSKPVRQPREGISQRGLFLACYGLLIQGEKQKAEDASSILGPSDTGTVINKQLVKIKFILEKWFTREKSDSSQASSQGWLEYLYGMVLAKDQCNDLAKPWLLKSVSINPWNWGAWQELRCLVRDPRELDLIYSQLQPSIMAFIFSIYCRQELHQVSASLISDISQLQKIFPGSLFLQGQRALVYYRMQDLELARSAFSNMLVSHPRYLDFLDHYSNVLYTLGSRDRLSFIAQLASSVESYRPETCCVIGNYYSLSSRHEAAIVQFRRALILDRSFAPAWTFLGYEYLKLENSHAALSSYLRAVNLNKQDNRAYFGLGHVYEALEQPKMSLEFYRRAALLRPGEMDIWQAMASCFVSMSKPSQAINSLKRALACTDPAVNRPEDFTGDTSLVRRTRLDILFQSASLHEELNNRQGATSFLEQCLDEAIKYCSLRTSEDGAHDQRNSIIPKTQLLLARWALDDGDYARARHFASQVEQPREYREEAQRLLNACTRR
ncbi:cell division cycle protein-like protein 23 [Hypoxylon argillaceum]|nr:cell division cycle protein-like protein 23 [Hypoxylon argillaceum]